VALFGLLLRVAATGGELWLDEVWSLIKVSTLSNPVEIFTTVKHDNNHLLNSLWMWVSGPARSPRIYRAPSLLFSALLLALLLRRSVKEEPRVSAIWLTFVSFSYPIILYGTEARGYALTVFCAVLAFLSMLRITTVPSDWRAIIAFAIAGIVGSLSHAIYALFLAPAVVWLIWQLRSSILKPHARAILWGGIAPPLLVACGLTVTFYRDMEIGGAPLLPYLEVAASTISVSFGGETLSSVDPAVTGWNLFLGFAVIIMCGSELIAWLRSGSPLALLVALIVVTPWIAVTILQPHFILARYFIIQVVFAYLLAARFLDRLIRQGRFGAVVASLLLGAFIVGNTSHTLTLARSGRSHFVAIFDALATQDAQGVVTVGGDQDFQNGIRLAYASMVVPSTSRLSYVANYRTTRPPPRYIIRETLESYEVMPREFTLVPGALYQEIQRYRAPQLNGSHVTVYELSR
jgi:hypothetical protein